MSSFRIDSFHLPPIIVKMIGAGHRSLPSLLGLDILILYFLLLLRKNCLLFKLMYRCKILPNQIFVKTAKIGRTCTSFYSSLEKTKLLRQCTWQITRLGSHKGYPMAFSNASAHWTSGAVLSSHMDKTTKTYASAWPPIHLLNVALYLPKFSKLMLTKRFLRCRILGRLIEP